MLNAIQIQNLAIIEDISLSFTSGFTVFTGETGAGKSIIVDALSLALGARCDSSQIRAGQNQCQVIATFACTTQTRQKLQQLDIEVDDQIIIRRVITHNGSRCYLNDQQVTLQTIKSVTTKIAAIQGQHAYRTLQDKEQQKLLLDKYGRIDTGTIQSIYAGWKDASVQIEAIRSDTMAGAGMELASYQCKELDQANPEQGEYESLDEEHKLLAHGEQLLSACANIMDRLNGENGIVSGSAEAAGEVREMAKLSPSFGNIAELLQDASIAMQEAAREMNHQLEKINPDPERLRQAESRIQTLHELARKHKVQPSELPQKHQQLREKLELFNNLEHTIKQLVARREQFMAAYRQEDRNLHKLRQRTADSMQQEVAATLQSLGMQKSTMEINMEQTAQPTPSGSDNIEFYSKINPGMPATPLRKTASGGELSRICLAIHASSPNHQETGMMVFDEIDSGTGGAAAAKIGILLKQMSTHTQVFCITHQAQIAATADQHYKIEKEATQTTKVKATELTMEQRQEEIARMLAGTTITRQSREHAKQMLSGLAN